MKFHQVVLFLFIAVFFRGCLDFDGSNAKAEAQALADAGYADVQEAVILRDLVTQVEAGQTERTRAYYAALVALQGGNGAAQPPAPVPGTLHDGGATAGFSLTAGLGVGWQLVLVLIVGTLALIILLSYFDNRTRF